MNRLKKFFEKHLFLIWIICSVLFALIIHCLFSITAPNEWLVAKWGAGDILTFVSTVALGLLAVWQNKKFKEENNAAQDRLENLTKKSNELSAINKIIEHENIGISRLKTRMQSFISACNTEATLVDLTDVAHQPDDFKKLFLKIKMDNRNKQIRICTIELLSELRAYSNNVPDNAVVIKLINLISKYSEYSIELTQKIRTSSSADGTYKEKIDAERELIINFSDFISNREALLNKVIFEYLTLDQIKEMYSGHTR